MMWKQPTEIEIVLFPTLAWNWGKDALPEETCIWKENTFWHSSGKPVPGVFQKQM